MTPKEKAQQILTMLIDAGINESSLKLVATIAVNETLNMFVEIHNKFQDVGLLKFSVEEAATYKFWQEVKQEIKKYDSN